ncbi:MAG: mandelate racemase/muconate lactonizing enzyme family protein [Spirochaetales bacterium]
MGSKITYVRPVLLSSPYAHYKNAEVLIHLPQGYRTCSFVEITLDNGITGLGEGYIGVFAPHVFEEIVKLITPHLIGKEIMDTNLLYSQICSITDYWSLQGAARHVISAFEIAFIDAKSKLLNIPAYDLFGGSKRNEIQVYGSGGDSIDAEYMEKEFEYLIDLGISIFKIRARNYEAHKTVWCLKKGTQYGIRIAVDMAQNLANPGQTISDVIQYLETISQYTNEKIFFLEEVFGCQDTASYAIMRQKTNIPICGGETITTAFELSKRIEEKYYDFVQPDATVIGGMGEVNSVFDTCKKFGVKAVVHCWGSAVCMMANYHIAFANGADLVEFPMPQFNIRQDLMIKPLEIVHGKLQKPTAIGLGVQLTPELEKKYAFREDAVYNCDRNTKAVYNDSWDSFLNEWKYVAEK